MTVEQGDLLPEANPSVRSSEAPPGGVGDRPRINGRTRPTGGEVAALMGQFARSLHAEGSLEETLAAITRAAVDTIAGADHAGITLVTRGRRVETTAATDPVVEQIDMEQYQTGEGPCLTTLWERTTVRVDDMHTDGRWPRFAERVRRTGVRSVLSFQLHVGADDLGALNLYSDRVTAFDAESEGVGLLLASHAAVALADAQREAQLTRALGSRDVIGQAKGILMERHGIDPDEAFRLLVRTSQQLNRKLRDVAGDVVRTRRDPRDLPPT